MSSCQTDIWTWSSQVRIIFSSFPYFCNLWCRILEQSLKTWCILSVGNEELIWATYHYQKASHWIVKLPLMKDSRTNGGISGGGNYILLFGFRALLRKHCFTSENKEKSFGFTYKLCIYLQEIHTKVNVFSTW